MVRRTLTFVAVLAGFVAVVVGTAWMFQRSLIYFPDRGVPEVKRLLPGAEEVTFPTDDGLELHGWYLPASEREIAAAVVFNGNAGNRGDRAVLARQFAARGIATLLFDYRGFGGNEGSPTESGLVADGRAAVAFLRDRAAGPLVYFGESLGSAVATEVAVNSPPDALVLRSPFTSLVDVGEAHYGFLPVSTLLKDRYPTIDRIAFVSAPVLVLAGTDDEVVPYTQSTAVFDAAPGDKHMVTFEGSRHNDTELASSSLLVAEVVTFVRRVLRLPFDT